MKEANVSLESENSFISNLKVKNTWCRLHDNQSLHDAVGRPPCTSHLALGAWFLVLITSKTTTITTKSRGNNKVGLLT